MFRCEVSTDDALRVPDGKSKDPQIIPVAPDVRGGKPETLYRTSTHEWSCSHLRPNTLYTIVARSRSKGGASEWGRPLNILTLPAMHVQLHKDAQGLLAVDGTSVGVDVAMATGCEVSLRAMESPKPLPPLLSKMSAEQRKEIGAIEKTVSEQGVVTLKGLRPGTHYEFQAKLRRDSKAGAAEAVAAADWTAPISFRTHAAPPPPPLLHQAGASVDSLTLGWVYADTALLESIELEWVCSDDQNKQQIAERKLSATFSAERDKGAVRSLLPSTRYSLRGRVRPAADASGRAARPSEWSAPIHMITRSDALKALAPLVKNAPSLINICCAFLQ